MPIQFEGTVPLTGPGFGTQYSARPRQITYLDGKLSSELSAQVDTGINARAIIEIVPENLQRFNAVFPKLNIPRLLDIDFSKYNMALVSTIVARKHLDTLRATSEVRRLHSDRQFQQNFNWPWPVANAVRDRLPRRDYKLKAGDVTTGTSRRAIGGDKADADGMTGKGVKAVITDSGFAQNRQFALGQVTTKTVIPGVGFLGDLDTSGHGTHVASTFGGDKVEVGPGAVLQGMAPGTDITTVRCLFTPLGMGLNSFTLKALQIADRSGADIISMSLGTGSQTPPEDPLYKIVQAMVNDGKLIFTSVGNSQHIAPGQVNGPADIPGVISVGAWVMSDNSPAYFSVRGQTASGTSAPMFYAPGGGRVTENLTPMERIVSSSAGYMDAVDSGFHIAGLMGSSQACPHVSGMAALWQQYAIEKTGRKLNYLDFVNVWKNFDTGNRLFDYGWIREVVS